MNNVKVEAPKVQENLVETPEKVEKVNKVENNNISDKF
jgi:hypothetical protein